MAGYVYVCAQSYIHFTQHAGNLSSTICLFSTLSCSNSGLMPRPKTKDNLDLLIKACLKDHNNQCGLHCHICLALAVIGVFKSKRWRAYNEKVHAFDDPLE